MPKSFPTCTTCKGFFSCMNSLMLNKSCTLAKGYPTFQTLIRFLSCMNSLV
ncbi:hypothetical protein DBR06_SOUSAS21310027, partial [Sousa chinensis]